MDQPVLQMQDITKQFGTFTAVDCVNISLKKGEVLTLLGENGAGKSTLMNVLCGLYRPTSGKIILNGKETAINSPADAVSHGIGMVHQHFMLVEAFTVFQNIIMGTTSDKSFVIDEKKLKKDIQELSDKYGLNIEFDKKITEISVGAQQRVEIVKTLWRGAEILILDEPTAVLTDEETVGLFEIIHKLNNEGKSVIFISHKMREVMEISDTITVLRAGKVIETFSREQADEQTLANTMVGRKMTESKYLKADLNGEPVLQCKNLSFNKESKHNGLNNISFEIKKGEIFGVAGVDGNGQSELAALITGLIHPDEGELKLKGSQVSLFDPNFFIGQSVSHIPEDRNKMGLIGGMTIKENLMMKKETTPEFSQAHGWKLNKDAIKKHSNIMRIKYDIRCRSTDQLVSQLSGGNQQKVILARELECSPDLLIAVHPIRGLDIGAAQFIHDQLIQARDRGCAILLISTDLAEVLLISDQITVMFEGKMIGPYDGKNPPMEEIAMAMSGREETPVK